MFFFRRRGQTNSSPENPGFGSEGGDDTVALSPAAESSRSNTSVLNYHALKISSVADSAVPTLAPYPVESQAPGAGQQQLSVASNGCHCIVCAGVGKKVDWFLWPKPCRVPGCSVPDHDKIQWNKILKTEASHFRTAGEAKFNCAENDCTVAVSSITDLRRHYTNKHCTKSEKFPCPLIWCKYSGDNGFKRKDKLKSHYRNAHEGKKDPSRAFRITKSSSLGEGPGGNGIGASRKPSTPPFTGN